MRFYTTPHRFYCGIDLHARTMHVCVLDAAGTVVCDRNLPATMQEDHEHVEHSEGRSRDDEEIDRDEVGEVISEERAPSLRGRLRPTRHEPGNGALRDVEPSLSNSPWMRGAPQSGFASVMVRTRSA